MSKVSIQEITLTNIGDAIREKTGKTALIAPGDMPAEIRSIVSGGGGESGNCNGLHVPEEALVISGDCEDRFAHSGWDWFINNFKDYITTKDINNAAKMFYVTSGLDTIPFALNFKSGSAVATNYMFASTNASFIGPLNNLKPTNMQQMFSYCKKLKELPVINNWDWSGIDNATSAYTGQMNGLFLECNRLRTIPQEWLSHVNPKASYSNYYTSLFEECNSLEIVENIPVPTGTAWTSNAFNKTFAKCIRLKKFTFAMQEDGSPYVVRWKNQIIDFTTTGYKGSGNISWDFTDDTKIADFSDWRGYTQWRDGNLNNPDGWAKEIGWSVFSRTAATELINTLPDASAYLATSGGTNTIKFKTGAGASVMEGQPYPSENISELDEETIALASARGWTIAFA